MDGSDPATPPDILASLAKSSESAVRRAVAENPNTPVEVLNALWNKFPEALLANPIVALWELTEPAALQRSISPAACLASYNHLRKIGADLAPQIHTHEALKKAIEHAFRQEDTRVFEYAPFDPVAELRLMFVKTTISSLSGHFFRVKAPEISWQCLSNDPQPAVRRNFAQLLRLISGHIEGPSPHFVQATRALAASNDEEVFLELAKCPLIPGDVVQRLALSDSLDIRCTLSHCTNTPQESIERLCHDPDESVRLAFAKNCPLERAHELLLKDPSHKVRETLASNYRVSRQILLQFDLKDDPAVLRNVVLNSHAGEELRNRILKEGHPDVKQVFAHDGFRLPPRLYFAHKKTLSEKTLSKLSHRTGLHPDIVADLATNPDASIRHSIARRLRGQYGWRDTPSNLALLERFSADPDQEIRKRVCTDPRLTSKQTAHLARDSEPEVREEVLESVLQRLEKHRNCDRTSSYAAFYRKICPLLVEAANDPAASVRLLLAHGRETPPSALGILFDDPDENIRSAARRHSIWPFGAVLDFENAHPKFKGPTRHGDTSPSLSVLHHFARSRNPFLRQLTAQCSRTRTSNLLELAADSHPVVREIALARIGKRKKPKTSAI